MHAMGVLLAVLGIGSGGLLSLNAAGLLGGVAQGYTLWLLYPVFSLMGLALFVVPASAGQIRATARLGAMLHTALAGLSATALVVAAAGLVEQLHVQPALWYVLAVSLLLAGVWQTCAGSAQTASNVSIKA